MQTKVVELDLNDVLPNRFQPRIKFSEESIQALADSIKVHGVIQPIVVRIIGDKYEIIAGERRYKASILAGKKTIPAIITELNEKDSAEVAIIENVQRKDLTAIEEAISYKKILDMGYLTQDSLALKLGKTQSTIANKLRLLNLDDDVQEALLNEKISERHARSLLRLDTHDKQRRLLEKIINERLTVRKTDEEIDKMMDNNIETFNFGFSSNSVQEPNNKQEEILEIFNPNIESLNIPTEPIDEDNSIDIPNIEKVTSFFNPMPEIINSTVPPVSLDLFNEPVEQEKEKELSSNVNTFEPINNVSNNLGNIDNMTDIFTEKPLAPIDSLLQSSNVSNEVDMFGPPLNMFASEPFVQENNDNNENIEVSNDNTDEESNEDILVPGKFFNLMPEEEEKTEEISSNNSFSFDFNGINNLSPINSFEETNNSFGFETQEKFEPNTESLFSFNTFESDNNLNQKFESNVVTESEVESPVLETAMNVEPLQNLPVNEEFLSNQNFEMPLSNYETNIEDSIPELDTNISIPSLKVEEEVKDSKDIKSAIEMVREFSENLSKLGYIVDLDEFDFENMYQVVFKINK